VGLVARTLKELGLSSDVLRLEVTEQAMLEDQRIAIRMMEELRILVMEVHLEDKHQHHLRQLRLL
jgi:EAL domain-containing protein (putative c-di-GMP-specific phosphodiesterase class I)